MTSAKTISHFYGDDCDPPHTEDFLDEIIRESTERDPEFPQKLAEAEQAREGFLDAFKRLDREATGSFDYTIEDGAIVIRRPDGKPLDGKVLSAYCGLIVLIRNHTAEIIEAFELAAEIAERGVANFHSRESPTIGCEAPWGAAGPCSCGAYGLWQRLLALLSKVSGT